MDRRFHARGAALNHKCNCTTVRGSAIVELGVLEALVSFKLVRISVVDMGLVSVSTRQPVSDWSCDARDISNDACNAGGSALGCVCEAGYIGRDCRHRECHPATLGMAYSSPTVGHAHPARRSHLPMLSGA